jgi:hypothetical protein
MAPDHRQDMLGLVARGLIYMATAFIAQPVCETLRSILIGMNEDISANQPPTLIMFLDIVVRVQA